MKIEFTPGFLQLLLGALIGAMVMLGLLATLVGRAYRERSLHVHALSIACALASVARLHGGDSAGASAALVLALAASTQNLREMTLHVGALRSSGPWLTRAAVVVGLMAPAAGFVSSLFLVAGMVAWTVAGSLVLKRAWRQSLPWVPWAVAASLSLLAACVAFLATAGDDRELSVTALLCLWALALYLACVWRSRIFGEIRVRRDAEHQYDPITGLSKPSVLAQRVHLARLLMRRFRHSSSLLLVLVDHVPRIAESKGGEVAEAAVLEAGTRIRDALGQGDVAARIGADRFMIFSEGTPASQAALDIAAKAIAIGLREPLQALPGLYVQFRVVLCELPLEDVALDPLVAQLGLRVEVDAARQRERRIRIVAGEELAAAVASANSVSPSGGAAGSGDAVSVGFASP